MRRSTLLAVGGGAVVVVAVLGLTVARDAGPRGPSITDVAPETLDLRADRDAVALRVSSDAAQRLRGRLLEDKVLFSRPGDVALTANEREQALGLFADVLDHMIALDALGQYHHGFWKLSVASDRARHARHLLLATAAYVEKLSLGLALVQQTLNRPQFERLFDEGNPALGLKPGAYRRLKWNVVHVEEAAKTLALHGYLKLQSGALAELSRDPRYAVLIEREGVRFDEVKGHLAGRGVQLFGGNSVDIAKDGAYAAWFPLQSGAAERLGDTKVRRLTEMLISPEQVKEASRLSRPGDIIVERRNWYLSNIGLPGFWPHAALWLGTPQELSAAFDDDSDVRAAYGGSFTGFLADRHRLAWGNYTAKDAHGNDHRIIEAVSEGVVFSAAEESLHADYVAALRPVRLSALDKARAIERAFSYAGRPYDFNFDFFTDAALVCSELVFKAYEPREGCAGLKLPLERLVGRTTLGPNTIVRLVDQEYDSADRQLELAWFLDGSETTGQATFATVTAFRRSHLRPKWDVVQR